jgi:hypothetical protein
MKPSWSTPGRVAPIAALVVGALLFVPAAAPAQRGAGPFEGLDGSWSGGGTVTLSSGAREPLRCRATYNVENAGNAMKMRLRCASDSYRFDLTGTVANNGGALGGSWSEDTRRVSGSVSGRATPDRVDARITGPTFQAGITVAMSGRRSQSVTISSDGSLFRNVAITMSRGGS